MTLDEAIKHADEVASANVDKCPKCGREHRQLSAWLRELKDIRAVMMMAKKDEVRLSWEREDADG